MAPKYPAGGHTAPLYSKGFTLIEVLVTIAIIVVLAIIAIVPYYRYVDNAKRGKALADARSCIANVAAQIAQNPTLNLSEIQVPSNCTLNSTGSCTCTYEGYSATCESANNSITCSIDQ